MNRRTVLAGLGVGIASLAGCSENEPADSATSPTPAEKTETPSETPMETPGLGQDDGGGAEPDSTPLRLLSINAPQRVEIGRTVGYRFTLENPTDEPLRFQPRVSSRVPGSDWSELDRWESVEFAPGQIRSFNSTSVTSEYLQTKEIRIDELREIFTIEFVERQLPFRESHIDPMDREVTAYQVNLRENFEYTANGVERFADAGEDHQWALLDVRVINRSDDPRRAPPYEWFSMLNGDETFQPLPIEHDDSYNPVQLPPGAGASGVVIYKVPESLLSGDLQASWRGTFEGGDVGVVWSPH